MTPGDYFLWVNLKGSAYKYDQKKPRTQYQQLINKNPHSFQ